MKTFLPVFCMVVLTAIGKFVFDNFGILGYMITGALGAVVGTLIADKIVPKLPKINFVFWKDISENNSDENKKS